MQNPNVTLVYTAIGGGHPGGNAFEPAGVAEARKATLSIELQPREERELNESRRSRISCVRR